MLMTIFLACFAWGLMILFFCSAWHTLKIGTEHLRKMHQIPCSGCDYFTNDYRLKCTVNPIKACSEDAIGCIDFEPKTANCNACQQGRRKLF
ncbi:MAG: hypothetical protein QNJ36_09465 [Calothrix sp. MO_167.B42]|nr:hypothetical protein [Calothrix sp. MO_167.B42]